MSSHGDYTKLSGKVTGLPWDTGNVHSAKCNCCNAKSHCMFRRCTECGRTMCAKCFGRDGFRHKCQINPAHGTGHFPTSKQEAEILKLFAADAPPTPSREPIHHDGKWKWKPTTKALEIAPGCSMTGDDLLAPNGRVTTPLTPSSRAMSLTPISIERSKASANSTVPFSSPIPISGVNHSISERTHSPSQTPMATRSSSFHTLNQDPVATSDHPRTPSLSLDSMVRPSILPASKTESVTPKPDEHSQFRSSAPTANYSSLSRLTPHLPMLAVNRGSIRNSPRRWIRSIKRHSTAASTPNTTPGHEKHTLAAVKPHSSSAVPENYATGVSKSNKRVSHRKRSTQSIERSGDEGQSGQETYVPKMTRSGRPPSSSKQQAQQRYSTIDAVQLTFAGVETAFERVDRYYIESIAPSATVEWKKRQHEKRKAIFQAHGDDSRAKKPRSESMSRADDLGELYAPHSPSVVERRQDHIRKRKDTAFSKTRTFTMDVRDINNLRITMYPGFHLAPPPAFTDRGSSLAAAATGDLALPVQLGYEWHNSTIPNKRQERETVAVMEDASAPAIMIPSHITGNDSWSFMGPTMPSDIHNIFMRATQQKIEAGRYEGLTQPTGGEKKLLKVPSTELDETELTEDEMVDSENETDHGHHIYLPGVSSSNLGGGGMEVDKEL